MAGCSPRAAYVAMDPAAGISRASRPMHHAQSRHATRAKITDRGSDPPANATPAGIDAAIAAPGAMSVMLWKRTSRSPIASLRRPVFVVAGAVAVIASPGGRRNGCCADDPTAGHRDTARLFARRVAWPRARSDVQ